MSSRFSELFVRQARLNDKCIFVNIKNFFFLLPCFCDSKYRNKNNTNFWVQVILLRFTVLGFFVIVLGWIDCSVA